MHAVISLKKENLEIKFNEENGRISSIKYADKEFVGGSVPLFKIKLPDRAGEAQIFTSDDFAFLGAEEKNGTLTLFFTRGVQALKATVSAGSAALVALVERLYAYGESAAIYRNEVLEG